MDPSASAQPVPVIPGYRIVERIGVGGFGEVFRARQDVIERDVAIKVLHPRYSKDPDAVARFVAEARAVGRLSHPNIVDVIEFGTLSDGRQFCAMELVRGATLRELLRQHGRLPVAEALTILRGIAHALDAAHAAGVAHRDLKPDNVFVLDDGGVKLIDFGLAKLTREDEQAAPVTQTGAVLGTPLYMSPEQCRGKATTPATDAYSFGVLAYQLLVGEPPFTGDALALALHHLHDVPVLPSRRRPDLGRHVDHALLALMAKAPAARPMPLRVSVEALAGRGRLARPQVRRRWWGAILALVLVATGGAIAWGLTSTSSRRPVVDDRVLRIRFDGLGVIHRLVDDKVIYRDASGWWSYEIATGAVERAMTGDVASFARLRDGRIIVADRDGDRLVALEDPRTGTRTVLYTLPERPLEISGISLSPDEQKLALIARQHLVVIDLVTGVMREHDQLRTWSTPRWSPDGTRILVDHPMAPPTERLSVVDARNGTVVPISAPVLSEPRTATIHPADWLDARSIVYCADGQPGSLRVRAVDDASESNERTLARFDSGVSRCMVTVAGDRILVAHIRERPNFGALDTSALTPEVRLIAGDTGHRREVRALSADGEHAFVDADGKLVTISMRTGAVAPATSCAGDAWAVRRERDVLQMVVETTSDATLLQLRKLTDCSIVSRWRLPRDARLHANTVSCGGRVCAVGGSVGGEARVWRLDEGESAREIWNGGIAPDQLLPSTAVAPDDRYIVAGLCGAVPRPLQLIAADGTISTVPFERACGGLAWGSDPSQFLVVTSDSPDAKFGLALVSIDGAEKTIWTSDTVSSTSPRMSPYSSRVAVTVRNHQQELHLLELR